VHRVHVALRPAKNVALLGGQLLDLNSTSLLEHLGRIIEMGARMARVDDD